MAMKSAITHCQINRFRGEEMARKRATLTDLLNNLTYRLLYEKYKLLCCSSFEWNGIEQFGMKNRHIEELLFNHGKCGFFENKGGTYMCLKADDAGEFNVYNDPLNYNITGLGFNKTLSADDVVIIENNMFRMNTRDFIMFYVNKMYEAERTMDVNVKTAKVPFIFACDKSDVLSFKQIFQKIDGNEPIIYANKNLNLDSLTVLKTDANFICNEIQDYKKTVENELLTFLGFNNLAVDKKERVIESEANSNNDIISSFADLQLKSRQKACEEIKEKFGIEIKVTRKDFTDDKLPELESNT